MIYGEHRNVDDTIREHGQEWAECRDCGAQWSVIGSDFELVTEGDGYCLGMARDDYAEPDPEREGQDRYLADLERDEQGEEVRS